MEVKWWCLVLSIVFLGLQYPGEVSCQEAQFELPVQLVGFPFIILAVRLTNFVKKLSYSLSPATYRARTRRGLPDDSTDAIDALEVEKHVVRELGARACVYERVCAHYAQRALSRVPVRSTAREQLDWNNVFSQYKRSPDQNKEFYLLSVFLGNIVGSPQLCHQLAKRRPCEPETLSWSPSAPSASSNR